MIGGPSRGAEDPKQAASGFLLLVFVLPAALVGMAGQRVVGGGVTGEREGRGLMMVEEIGSG